MVYPFHKHSSRHTYVMEVINLMHNLKDNFAYVNVCFLRIQTGNQCLGLVLYSETIYLYIIRMSSLCDKKKNISNYKHQCATNLDHKLCNMPSIQHVVIHAGKIYYRHCTGKCKLVQALWSGCHILHHLSIAKYFWLSNYDMVLTLQWTKNDKKVKYIDCTTMFYMDERYQIRAMGCNTF